MRITIVGCGYVGRALARHWRQDPTLRLTVTTTREDHRPRLAPLAERVEVLHGGDTGALRRALEGAEVAVFCQAPTGDRQVSAEDYAATYRDSFAALAELVGELPQLRQIIYTGSCSVYGDAGGAWVDETSPPCPRDEHGRVLVESEELLARCRGPQRRVCVLRLGAIHGPGREPGERFRRLAGTTRPGDGRQHTSWIHRDDVVGAIAAAVRDGWDGVVNLVDDRPLPVVELLDQVCAAGGLEPVRWDPASAGATPPADRRISNRRLHGLGYRLRHPRLRLPQLKGIDQDLFDAVAAQAREAPRRRRNHNLHRESDGVQRFLNVLQPGTYVRPHRHLREQAGSGFECFLVLQGAIGLLVLGESGEVIALRRLEAGGPLRGVELAEGQFHTLVALSPDTVLFELKQGPYRPSTDKDFLSTFPPEGTAAAEAQERRWRTLFEQEFAQEVATG
jgi:cupin fold WbuC family metalloprotein